MTESSSSLLRIAWTSDPISTSVSCTSSSVYSTPTSAETAAGSSTIGAGAVVASTSPTRASSAEPPP